MSVSVSAQGKILVGQGNPSSVSELDGYEVRVVSSAPPGNGRAYGSPGGQIWTVVPGGLAEYRDGAWEPHDVPEIATAFNTGVTRLIDPVPLCPVRQGVVLFLLPSALLEYNVERPEAPRLRTLHLAAQTGLEKFSGMVAGDGVLWVAGSRGIAKVPGPVRNLKPETPWQEFLVPDSLHVANLQCPEESEDNLITAVAESTERPSKCVLIFDGQSWTNGPAGAHRIRHAWRSADGLNWACTIDSLFQWEDGASEMVENEDISARQFFDVAVEPGGRFWLATSEGMFRYAPLPWRSERAVRKLGLLVHSLATDDRGRLWFLAGNNLHMLSNEQHQEYGLPTGSLRALQSSRALFALKDGSLIINADDQDLGQRLVRFEPATGSFVQVGGGAGAPQRRALGALKNGNLAVLVWSGEPSDKSYRLEVFDDQEFQAFSEPLPKALAGVELSGLFASASGDVWVSAETGTAWLHEHQWRVFTTADPSAPKAVLAFAEVPGGRLWGATRDRIWEFDGRNWSEVQAGFDRINALLSTRDGTIWVASSSGLYRFFQGAWVDNGVEEGLASPVVRDLCEDSRGRLWAGTTRGLSVYHPEADPDPPRTQIRPLAGKERNVPEGGSITLSFTGLDRWKYTAESRLLFSHRLDEGEWSMFQELNRLNLSDLPPGKHYFQVRAMDRSCNVDPVPARLEFVVVLPWYRETRLVLISVTGLIGALFFAGLAFNRHRQLVRSYAEVEEKVAERTRQLDLANRELLHRQKMTAMGTLAAGIAHDFNNILSIIKGSAQVIEDNLADVSKVQTRVDRIKTVVEQGAGIVRAMLGFSRESGEDTGPCDLNAVMADTVKLLGDRFLRDVAISFQPTKGLPIVSVSKNLIQQILLNFIFNAAESMTQPKRILLTAARVEDLPADLALAPQPAGAYVAISVRDSGCGIPAENLPRIFEPFFTTKAFSTRRGTGLGLSMVYELAKKMHAGLAVASVVGRGSTFTLILPVVPEPPPTPPVGDGTEVVSRTEEAPHEPSLS
jgi:signal transduction histidine kinase/ligand-binding sensor domain-containing protein